VFLSSTLLCSGWRHRVGGNPQHSRCQSPSLPSHDLVFSLQDSALGRTFCAVLPRLRGPTLAIIIAYLRLRLLSRCAVAACLTVLHPQGLACLFLSLLADGRDYSRLGWVWWAWRRRRAGFFLIQPGLDDARPISRGGCGIVCVLAGVVTWDVLRIEAITRSAVRLPHESASKYSAFWSGHRSRLAKGHKIGRDVNHAARSRDIRSCLPFGRVFHAGASRLISRAILLSLSVDGFATRFTVALVNDLF